MHNYYWKNLEQGDSLKISNVGVFNCENGKILSGESQYLVGILLAFRI